MRLVGTLDDKDKASTFSHFLEEKTIDHRIEIKSNQDWESSSYGTQTYHIWIYDEEQFQQVLQWFDLFNKNREDALFKENFSSSIKKSSISPILKPSFEPPPSKPQTNSWEKASMGKMTRGLLIICCGLFFLSQFWLSSKTPTQDRGLLLFNSPIEKALLYDYPQFYQLLDRFTYLYGFDKLKDPVDLSPNEQKLLQQINHTPFWPGIYQIVLKKGVEEAKNSFSKYPTFEKIRKGEVWRLFSPCLLHGDLFHLFFNMLWLIVLGKQIEQRLKPLRYAIFIIIIGVVSNTAQYLISGPNFIGFSGILCGMLAFIWVRQGLAAWEGYQIDRMTLIFMLVFILGMAGIQLTSFILEKSFDMAFSPNIANTAHLVGGIMGFLFGRLNFFSWRIS